MKRKKWAIASIATTMIAVVGLAGCGTNNTNTNTTTDKTSSSSKETYTFKLADNQPTNYPTVVADKAFAKEVLEKTNGRVNIKVYPNAQLGDEKSVIEQVQLGAIDFSRINTGTLSEYDKQLGIFNLPYLFNSSKQMWDVLNGPIGDKLLQSLSSVKMVGLTYYDSGARSFYNSLHPVEHPSDLKGLKIRVQQSSMFVDMVNQFGASAIPMNYGDVYNALQTHVIDGAENNLPSYYTTNHYKTAKYLTLDEHTRNPEILMASSTSWTKLSDADKKIIQQAAVDSQGVERKAWTDLEKQSLDAAKENNNVITTISDISEWQKAVQPLYDKYGKDYKDLIDQIRATK